MGREDEISTNDVFDEFSKRGARITVKELDSGTVLVEGDKIGLEFLASVILACAKGKDHSVQFSPTGAGARRFTKESTLGFYIHRTPCDTGDAPSRGRVSGTISLRATKRRPAVHAQRLVGQAGRKSK